MLKDITQNEIIDIKEQILEGFRISKTITTSQGNGVYWEKVCQVC